MTSSVNATSTMAVMPSPDQGEAVAVSIARKVAGALGRAARAFAAKREAARVASLTWRNGRGDWQTAARERYLGDAIDLSDLERRQRAWDRDESNAYRLSGWS